MGGITAENAAALKERMEKDQDIGLIIGSSVGALMPHVALAKLLVEKGVISKEELNATYDKLLDASKYPKGIAEMLKPIWDGVKKGR